MRRGEFVLPLTAELGRVLAPGREILVRCEPCWNTPVRVCRISLYIVCYIYICIHW